MLPSRAPRSCFTIWLSEGRSKAAGVAPKPLLPPPDSGEPSEALWRFLMQPAVRQHVCRLAYAGEQVKRKLGCLSPCDACRCAFVVVMKSCRLREQLPLSPAAASIQAAAVLGLAFRQ